MNVVPALLVLSSSRSSSDDFRLKTFDERGLAPQISELRAFQG